MDITGISAKHPVRFGKCSNASRNQESRNSMRDAQGLRHRRRQELFVAHRRILCRVAEVFVKDTLFDADGSLHLNRAQLVAYAHGQYVPLRERPEGFFGYSVAREEVVRRRLGAPASPRRPERKKAPDRPAGKPPRTGKGPRPKGGKHP